jgi:hypothetical protein
MKLFGPLFSALNAAGVRYVVVGGLATVLHGYARLTADVDLIIDLAPEQARRVMEVLRSLGFTPRAPVDSFDFAVPERRRSWIEEKGMRVFSMLDTKHPMREVDLFVEHPLDFEQLLRDSVIMDLDETTVRVASIPHLIQLKRLAGRPQDRLDIEALEEILKRQGNRG